MATLKRIGNINRPLIKGEKVLVPCIINRFYALTEWGFNNGIPVPNYKINKLYITPVINHPHNDKKNGQHEIHYHVDYRFIKHKNDSNFPTVINKHSKHYFVEDIRPKENKNNIIEYFLLPVINENFTGITPVEHINKSKLKHNCIHKGKCPHRGYDLSQVAAIDGVITCPLHGLQFDETTALLLNKKATG